MVLMLAGIVDPKLDSTACHPSPSSHCLSRRVICHHRDPVPTIMGGLVIRLQCMASFTHVDYRSLHSVQCWALRHTVRVCNFVVL